MLLEWSRSSGEDVLARGNSMCKGPVADPYEFGNFSKGMFWPLKQQHKEIVREWPHWLLCGEWIGWEQE